MAKIPSWIIKTANDEKGTSVKLTDDTYKKLLDMYKGGKLDEWATQVMEEIECLLDVVNTAIDQVSQKLEGKPAVAKTASPAKEKEKEKEKVEHTTPLDFGDERLKEEMSTEEEEEEEKRILPGTVNRKLPPKMKEPETTKWKEIRFNKRTGTWQTVISIRHTRNFMTEDEAVDFTKKAELNEKK